MTRKIWNLFLISSLVFALVPGFNAIGVDLLMPQLGDEANDEAQSETREQKKIPEQESEKANNTPTEAEIKRETENDNGNNSSTKYINVALKMDLFVPVNQLATTYALRGEVGYILPWWNPNISVVFEGGYQPLDGSGKNIDSEIGIYDFSWKVRATPLAFGVRVTPPLPIPLKVFGEAGASMLFVKVQSEVLTQKIERKDKAFGGYFGGGAELEMASMFSVFGGILYSDTRLDFNYDIANPEAGIIGGTSLLLGTRFTY